MIISPEKIVFENTTDIVDYVSRGMIPTRKNFEKVMLKVRCPDETEVAEDEVYIPNRIFINCDENALNDALTRVYENRVRNRNITLAVVGIAALSLLIGKASSSKKKNSDSDDDINVDDD